MKPPLGPARFVRECALWASVAPTRVEVGEPRVVPGRDAEHGHCSAAQGSGSAPRVKNISPQTKRGLNTSGPTTIDFSNGIKQKDW